MLVNSLLYIVVFCVISFLLCLFGVLISYVAQGPEMAEALFASYVLHFNGILIFGTGFGLVWFVRTNGKNVLAQLFNVLEIPEDEVQKITSSFSKSSSPAWLNLVAVPITLIGGFILWKSGYPLDGFAKYFLAAASISLYYAGGYLLAFFIYSIGLFRALEQCEKRIVKAAGATQIEFEALNHFFIVSSTIGVLALYLAFRGTLTANFVALDSSLFTGKLLVFPLIIFLPAPLLYSFYPRYVLKRIFDHDVIRRISRVEESRHDFDIQETSYKERLEMEKILLEIKDRLMLEMNSFSVFSLKDSPSLLISILMIFQFVVSKDNVVLQFLESLLK